jgi:hypothetical protein
MHHSHPRRPERPLPDFPWTVDSSSAHGNALFRPKSLTERAEPQIAGDTVTELVDFLLDRTLCFFEEVLAHALQRQLPVGSTLTEIAHELRAKEAPERFRITLAQGGEQPWKITYHVCKFDDA